MNETALSELDRWGQKLKTLGDIERRVAPVVASAFRRQLELQIARGTAPDGTPWEPTLDGHKPLQNAAKELDVRSSGSVVLATLTGPSVRHHLGIAKGGKKRQILPDKGTLPEPLVAAIKEAIASEILRR